MVNLIQLRFSKPPPTAVPVTGGKECAQWFRQLIEAGASIYLF